MKQQWKALVVAATWGGIMALLSAAGIVHRFMPEIVAYEMPSVSRAVNNGPGAEFGETPLHSAVAMSLLKTMLPPPQSNGNPLNGNWHAGAKEFQVNLNQGAATYTLATARSMAGNGLGIHIVKMAFWCDVAASGGTSFSVQSNDTTAVTYLASTTYATCTAGKNLTAYAGTAYLGKDLAIQYTIVGTGSGGDMVVSVLYVGQNGTELCSGSSSTC